MGFIQKLKDVYFGNFVAWMETKGLKENFSNDVWASKVWDNLYNEFSEEEKTRKSMEYIKKRMPKTFFQDALKEKESEEAIMKKMAEAKANNNIIQLKKENEN